MASVIYEKFKKLADDNSLTSEQVADMTKVQAADAMGINAGCVDDNVFGVAKKALLRELERAKWQKALEDLKAQLIGGDRVWLMNNFPNVEFEIEHRSRVVRIYLEGKSTAEEVQ